MTRLEFTDEEILELKRALEMQLHGLRVELVNTDNLEFKAGLRARLERLERVAARLGSSTTPDSAPPSIHPSGG